MQQKRQKRLAYAGRWGGVCLAYVARMVDDSPTNVRRRLIAWFQKDDYVGRQNEPAALGDFVNAFKTEQTYQRAAVEDAEGGFFIVV